MSEAASTTRCQLDTVRSGALDFQKRRRELVCIGPESRTTSISRTRTTSAVGAETTFGRTASILRARETAAGETRATGTHEIRTTPSVQ